MKAEMHVEKKFLPKPLFFGSQIPPRIRNELGESQNQSSSNIKDDNEHNISALDQHEAVKVVQNAIHMLGPRHLQSSITSNSHVSTYVPKWNHSQTLCNAILAHDTKPSSDSPPLLATNQTLTSNVPLFGCDDSALPNEADLGIFKTVDEEQITLKIREQEEELDKNTVSNILGNLKCPSPAHGPEDSVTWNSRAVGNNPNNLDSSSTNPANGKNPNSNASNHTSTSTQTNNGSNNNNGNTRIGWWNHSTSNSTDESHRPSTESETISFLEPTPAQLQTANLPLTHLPPASTMEKVLPYLSDKPPSMRYLQMDTYEVSFSCGWIEPLFCSLSIYHIDMDADMSSPNDSKSNSNNNTRTPPRCGRITESLWFDYYDHNPEFEKDFERSLYPHDADASSNDSNHGKDTNTTCGVFPLPSNFHVSNLFVVLIVHKTLSEDSDLEPYYRNNAGTHSTKIQAEETLKYRQKAKQNASRNGKLLTPFAFGVVALEHVIGSSQKMNRMLVQIPLFQYPSGKGDIPIIDNILHQFTCHTHSSVSTGDTSTKTTKTISGLGEMTHGGKAWLILRYLGYRGMYSALQPPPNSHRNNNNNSSNIANQTTKAESQTSIPYHRIIDFTKEFQVRRKHPDNGKVLNQEEDYHPNSSDFICESTSNKNNSNSYIQEMASISLSRTLASLPRIPKQSYRGGHSSMKPSSNSPPSSILKTSDKHAKSQPADIEPVMHTSITNEFLCLPQKLHHCSKRNIVIQCRLVECIWKSELQSYIAVPMKTPNIHNTRRGSILVKEAFTTCSYHTIDPHFLDEFKVKLPIILNKGLSLLFSIYHVHVKGKRRFATSVASGARSAKHALTNRIRIPLSPGSSVDTYVDNTTDDGTEDTHEKNAKRHLELLGCGILNLSSEENVLIDNDLHDVPIQFMSKSLDESSRIRGMGIRDYENVVSPLGSEGSFDGKENSVGSNGTSKRFFKSSNTSFSPVSSPTKTMEEWKFPEGTLLLETIESSDHIKSLKFPRSPSDDMNISPSKHDDNTMILQARTVSFSSIHCQCSTLSNFFLKQPSIPRPISDAELLETPWTLPKEDILQRSSFFHNNNPDMHEILLQKLTIDISSPSKCPHPELVSHFIRISSQLLQILVSGMGRPNLQWADPSAVIPLRLHAFSSLLILSREVTAYQNKNGMTKLNGKGRLDIKNMAKLISLLFDDELLFGNEKEVFPIDPTKNQTDDPLKDILAFNPENSDSSKNKSPALIPVFGTNTESARTKSLNKMETKYNDDTKKQIDAFSFHANPGMDTVQDQDRGKKNENLVSTDSNNKETIDTNTEVSKLKGDPIAVSTDVNVDFARWLSQDVGDSELESSSTKRVKPKRRHRRNISSPDDFNGIPMQSIENELAKDDPSKSTPVEEMNNNFSAWLSQDSESFHSSSSSDLNQNQTKIDTQFDFRCALNSCTDTNDDGLRMTNTRKKPADTFGLSNFAGGNGALSSRRKYMTLPSLGLATIEEDREAKKTDDESAHHASSTMSRTYRNTLTTDSLKNDDNDTVSKFTESHRGSKQFRIPKLKQSSSDEKVNESSSFSFSESDSLVQVPKKIDHVPKTDKEIEASGTAFLDVIEKNLGLGAAGKNLGAEEQLVGYAHHRTHRYGSSICFDPPPLDLLAERMQEKDHINMFPESSLSPNGGRISDDNIEGAILPDFSDRIAIFSKQHKSGRWCPYLYEVLIYQWVGILVEQTKRGEQTGPGGVNAGKKTNEKNTYFTTGSSPESAEALSEVAFKTLGIAIICAPILFELIKKSLSNRIAAMMEHYNAAGTTSTKSSKKKEKTSNPFLVRPDPKLFSTLEKLICVVTDACLDSRNFDSAVFRKTSIDVNDAVVRFLRDLFSVFEVDVVHRLILVYFSRYVVKDGKHWHDRDSKQGWSCSWEICKLRLNAVTLLIRFPEFVTVNKPIMDTWGRWPFSASAQATNSFFTSALNEIETFGMANFAASDGPVRRPGLNIPSFKPHWLAELITDICLAAAEHVDPPIKHRAASLLLEMFWTQSQEGKARGTLSVVASMYVPFIVKILGHINYLSILPHKHQLRKNILPCAIFVMQSAPKRLLRALWRKLIRRAEGKGLDPRYGGTGANKPEFSEGKQKDKKFFLNHDVKVEDTDSYQHDPKQSILDTYSLLNLAIKTFEFEAIDDTEEGMNNSWEKEFLLTEEPIRKDVLLQHNNIKKEKSSETEKPVLNTNSSRKWYSHDGAIVILNTSREIMNEAWNMLHPKTHTSRVKRSKLNPSFEKQSASVFLDNIMNDLSIKKKKKPRHHRSSSERNIPEQNKEPEKPLCFSTKDINIFSRAALSLYLNVLSLNQSDIVITRALDATIEIVKYFGIQNFFTAVGETFQHWMRVVLLHCGARRAYVRAQASEFLALVLRLTWDSFGSFFRVRVPLLAVQSEVMDRIVTTAARRYYRDQRKMSTQVEIMSSEGAEGSLATLWRTLDRLQNKSASENEAFKTAQMRLAETMKILFKAYIGANALAIVNRRRSKPPVSINNSDSETPYNRNQWSNRNDVILRQIISKSGYSREFVGHFSGKQGFIHNEAVEDAFLAAADVFSPTELPVLRVTWLRRLADFYSSRKKYAEEATCHFQIYITLRQAAGLHDSIWNSSPFLPWTIERSDGQHIDGEGPASSELDDHGLDSFNDLDEFSGDETHFSGYSNSGRQIETKNSFRRLFYRVPGSLRVPPGDWDGTGNANAFYGVTNISEYNITTSSAMNTVKEMEEEMIEDAELAGELFLKAGVIENSRYSWSLASQFYSETYNYARLSSVYIRLASVVASKVPVVDTNNQLELSSSLGRFYRVWFHGGDTELLIGTEFVHRVPSNVKLEQFGNHIKGVIKSLLPAQTPITLVLDDGRPEEQPKRSNKRISAGSVFDPIKIKVTPLRPTVKGEMYFRGSPEWFNNHIESPDPIFYSKRKSNTRAGRDKANHKFPSSRLKSSNLTVDSDYRSFSSAGTFSNASERFGSTNSFNYGKVGERPFMNEAGSLIGVDRFHYTQPKKEGRLRGSRDYLKSSTGDFAEKNLRVTQLQVKECFPACISRQVVINRTVFLQSPLEAGVEAVCSWCAVLFRTAVASNGMAVLGVSKSPGVGTSVTKVVADCIHNSKVKDIGLNLLKRNRYVAEEDENGDDSGGHGSFGDRLSEGDIIKNQEKLARGIVVFMELLHLLIVRNRDLLLAVIQARKRAKGGSKAYRPSRMNHSNPSSPDSIDRHHRLSSAHSVGPSVASSEGLSTDGSNIQSSSRHSNVSISGFSTGGFSTSSWNNIDRVETSFVVQSELQRAFLSMAKSLYSIINNVIHEETPRWLKLCSRTDGYFSSGSYRHTRISIGDELVFPGNTSNQKNFPNIINAASSRNPSPNGSFAGSAASKNSGSRKESSIRNRTPTSSSHHI